MSPVAVFCYNRPYHISRTLSALSENLGLANSDIFIFCDGPKSNISVSELDDIIEVRRIVRSFVGAKTTRIIEQKENIGLANSIIEGVSYVLSMFDRIIVLEDDICAETGFLKYMNDALEMYLDDERVGCVHAWNYNMRTFDKKKSTFFLRGADCWGWGTWKSSWELFNPNGLELYSEIVSRNLIYSFNRNSTIDFLGMLLDQINQRNDSWAIRWHASLFLKNKYCLHPVKPIVKNIGFDGSGTHCDVKELLQETTSNIELIRQNVVESMEFYQHFNTNIWSKYLTKLKAYLILRKK
jgi:hypothetical protein